MPHCLREIAAYCTLASVPSLPSELSNSLPFIISYDMFMTERNHSKGIEVEEACVHASRSVFFFVWLCNFIQ